MHHSPHPPPRTSIKIIIIHLRLCFCPHLVSPLDLVPLFHDHFVERHPPDARVDPGGGDTRCILAGSTGLIVQQAVPVVNDAVVVGQGRTSMRIVAAHRNVILGAIAAVVGWYQPGGRGGDDSNNGAKTRRTLSNDDMPRGGNAKYTND